MCVPANATQASHQFWCLVFFPCTLSFLIPLKKHPSNFGLENDSEPAAGRFQPVQACVLKWRFCCCCCCYFGGGRFFSQTFNSSKSVFCSNFEGTDSATFWWEAQSIFITAVVTFFFLANLARFGLFFSPLPLPPNARFTTDKTACKMSNVKSMELKKNTIKHYKNVCMCLFLSLQAGVADKKSQMVC